MNNYLDDLDDLEVQGLTNSYPPNRPIRPIPLIAARGVEPVIRPVNRVPYIYIPEVASVEKLIRELTKVKNIIDSPETSCNTAQQILKKFDTNYMYIFKHTLTLRYFDNQDVISHLLALEISIQNKNKSLECSIESKIINRYKEIFDIRDGGKRKKRNSIRLHLHSKRRKNKNKTNKKRRSRRIF
jgi:hypothetical protein